MIRRNRITLRSDGSAMIHLQNKRGDEIGIETLVDKSDLEVLSSHKWCAKSLKSMKSAKSYALCYIAGENAYLHRFLMNPGDLQVDHINGDGLDNRRSNLRLVTPVEQNQNKEYKNPTGFRNVRKSKHGRDGFIAVVKQKEIGPFRTAKEAAAAASVLRQRLFTHSNETRLGHSPDLPCFQLPEAKAPRLLGPIDDRLHSDAVCVFNLGRRSYCSWVPSELSVDLIQWVNSLRSSLPRKTVIDSKEHALSVKLLDPQFKLVVNRMKRIAEMMSENGGYVSLADLVRLACFSYSLAPFHPESLDYGSLEQLSPENGDQKTLIAHVSEKLFTRLRAEAKGFERETTGTKCSITDVVRAACRRWLMVYERWDYIKTKTDPAQWTEKDLLEDGILVVDASKVRLITGSSL